MRFIDLFAGLGGFNLALRALGHRCVFACEIDDDLREIYRSNFGLKPAGDLRGVPEYEIPEHDILCAGFPCQPFSKAGEQLGTRCKLWGDLFTGHVLRVIRHRQPSYFLMENVANLERHNGGKTWAAMRADLEASGYSVDTRILSPHRFGVPQIRERLFIVGSRLGLDHFSWPEESDREPCISSVLEKKPPDAKPISERVIRCLDVWQNFLDRTPSSVELPSFPIWSMEFGATYPFTRQDSLYDFPLQTLRNYKGSFGQTLRRYWREDLLANVPSYARAEQDAFPDWKQAFIRQNRQFYRDNRVWIKPWLPQVREFPSSLQKFEWNCKGEERNLWKYVIQFRASGVRIKRPTTAPSLVAMTTTQIPIIAWEKRYMTPRECSRLQSMDELVAWPAAEGRVYQALGNAVNARIVRLVAEQLCGGNKAARRRVQVA